MLKSPFQGQHITLRPFEPEDVSASKIYLNHPDLIGRRYLPWTFSETAPLSHAQVEAVYQKWSEATKSLHLAIVQQETQDLIGHAEFEWNWDPHCPSVAVVIAPTHQRQGYGSEALGLLLAYAFGYTPAHVISARAAEWNRAARAFAEHHGFQESGQMRRAGIRQGAYFDVLVVDMLRSEWQERGGTSYGD